MENKNKICTRCDTRNSNNARYCAGCGYELPKPVAESIRNPKPVYYQKTGSNKILFVIVAALIGLSILIGVLSIFFTQSIFKSSFPTTLTNEVVVAFAKEINKHCPTMIDNITRLDNVAVLPNNTLQYNYTIGVDKSQVDTVEFKRQMNSFIIESIKTQPTMVLIRKSKVQLRHLYKDSNSQYICTVEISPELYK